jgi:uncharacterized membrane protein YgcG
LNVPRTHRAFIPFAAVAASAALAACHRSDSILLVEVAGDLDLHPVALGVAVTIGTQTDSLQVPATPGVQISLPVSFSVEVDPSLTGPVSVAVDAKDGADAVIARGVTTQENIDVAGQTIITVTLISIFAPGTDADGVDAAGVDAGGGGGPGGGGGRGGGGSGAGGASAADASAAKDAKGDL